MGCAIGGGLCTVSQPLGKVCVAAEAEAIDLQNILTISLNLLSLFKQATRTSYDH